jgi:hypothetical protein
MPGRRPAHPPAPTYRPPADPLLHQVLRDPIHCYPAPCPLDHLLGLDGLPLRDPHDGSWLGGHGQGAGVRRPPVGRRVSGQRLAAAASLQLQQADGRGRTPP